MHRSHRKGYLRANKKETFTSFYSNCAIGCSSKKKPINIFSEEILLQKFSVNHWSVIVESLLESV